VFPAFGARATAGNNLNWHKAVIPARFGPSVTLQMHVTLNAMVSQNLAGGL